MNTIVTFLQTHTMPAAPELSEKHDDNRVGCCACAHRCVIHDGKSGICAMRHNVGGSLRVPSGYTAGLQVDPIEKKPFYHVLPGQNALSFGMLGCNFRCEFCQNWHSSQVGHNEDAQAFPEEVTADALVELAVRYGAPAVVSTYNEPLITAEWSVEIFRRAKEQGLLCGYVSNGHATPEVLRYLRPHMDAYKVDLKSFSQEEYRRMGGNLTAVLDSIACLYEMGFWVEIVTLVVPGMNDDEDQLRNIARFIASVSPDIPWHVTPYHPAYKKNDEAPTRNASRQQAYDIGRQAGLHYVYAGGVGDLGDTFCHSCNTRLVQRQGFHVSKNCVTDGRCPDCDTKVPGIFRSP